MKCPNCGGATKRTSLTRQQCTRCQTIFITTDLIIKTDKPNVFNAVPIEQIPPERLAEIASMPIPPISVKPFTNPVTHAVELLEKIHDILGSWNICNLLSKLEMEQAKQTTTEEIRLVRIKTVEELAKCALKIQAL